MIILPAPQRQFFVAGVYVIVRDRAMLQQAYQDGA
jgi:hypothetical protein